MSKYDIYYRIWMFVLNWIKINIWSWRFYSTCTCDLRFWPTEAFSFVVKIKTERVKRRARFAHSLFIEHQSLCDALLVLLFDLPPSLSISTGRNLLFLLIVVLLILIQESAFYKHLSSNNYTEHLSLHIYIATNQ